MSNDYVDHNPYKLPEPTMTSETPDDPNRDKSLPGTNLNGNQNFYGQKVDVVVVGTGASGHACMYELTTGGLKVVALDKGPFVPWNSPEYKYDELRNQKFNTVVVSTQADYPDTWRPDPFTPTITTKVIVCAEIVGGAVNHWATHYYRWKPIDFRMLSAWGPVPGADLADWPITYDDLEPFYTEMEYLVGQSGDADISSPFEPPHSRPFPNPPMPRKYSDILLEEAGRRIGRNVFPMPSAARSRPYGGGRPCNLCSFCSGYLCMNGAKGHVTGIIPPALATGNLEIRPNCFATRVLINASGRCTGVEYIDTTTGNYHVQEADIVVVAATAPRTTQILLLSANQHGLFPNGLGNSSGYLGKRYTAHHFSSASAYIDRNMDNWRGISANSNIHDWYEHYHDDDPPRDFVSTNGCMLGGGSNQPIGSRALNFAGTGPPSRRWGIDRKWYLRKTYGNNVAASCITSGLPRLENQIDLDPVVVNKWGLPVPRFTTSTHDNDRRASSYVANRVRELFMAVEGVVSTAAAGIAPGAHVRGNIHQTATAKMGNDPSTSVTNKWGQFHDVANLFCADPSIMTTQGGGDTTGTTTALGAWVGHHIVQRKGYIPLP